MQNLRQFCVEESKPWFRPESGWPAHVPKNLEFPRITLYELLAERAAETPEAPVLWFLGTFMSYRKLMGHVDAFAAGLKKLGVKKGDTVALAMPSCFQYPIAFYACAKLGAVVTGVNPISKPTEILHQLDSTGSRTLIVLDAICEPLFGPLRTSHPFDEIIATNLVDLVDMPPENKAMGKQGGMIPSGPVPDTAIQFMDLLATEPSPISDQVSTDDVATYVLTGGTTGVPKVAVLTHFNCVSSAVSVARWLWDSPGCCLIGILPLFHVFGMACLHTAIQNHGYAILFPKPPETEDLLKTVCAVGMDGKTFYPGAEVLFQQLAAFPNLDKYPVAKKINRCLSSAGPLHSYVKDRFEASLPGVVLREGYGLSESSSGIAIGPYDKEFISGSIGLPLPGVEWKIVDMEDGEKELPPGESGELILSAPMVMKEYLNNREETAEALREQDGKIWLYTGDIGYIDELGRVFLNDRKKQLIKVKGYSVFPTEVEELIARHEAVFESSVAGLPDPETGEAIKAWVVLKEEWKGQVTPEELRAWAKENMTHYKVPKYVEFIDTIPKTLVGKVLRRELKEADPIYKAFLKSQSES